MKNFSITIELNGTIYHGKAIPYYDGVDENEPPIKYNVVLNNILIHDITRKPDGWTSISKHDQALVNAVGNFIHEHIEDGLISKCVLPIPGKAQL